MQQEELITVRATGDLIGGHRYGGGSDREDLNTAGLIAFFARGTGGRQASVRADPIPTSVKKRPSSPPTRRVTPYHARGGRPPGARPAAGDARTRGRRVCASGGVCHRGDGRGVNQGHSGSRQHPPLGGARADRTRLRAIAGTQRYSGGARMRYEVTIGLTPREALEQAPGVSVATLHQQSLGS